MFGRCCRPRPAARAAKRFAALTPAARHDWLVEHLAALRAGRIPGRAAMTAGSQPRRPGSMAGAAGCPGRSCAWYGCTPPAAACRPPWPRSRRAPSCCGPPCYGPWDAYGALQLPLIFEAGCAVIIAVTTASPSASRSAPPDAAAVPAARRGAALTALAVGLLAAAGTGLSLAGGFPDVLRNMAGLTGIGLLCAALLGGPRAWIGPMAYLMIGVYALYTQWHPPTLSTPWLWPARPPHDLGAAICAGLVFAAGLAAIAIRGARDSAGGELNPGLETGEERPQLVQFHPGVLGRRVCASSIRP